MFLSGFLATLWIGGFVRAGGRVGRGMDPYPTQRATEESQQRARHAADRELALEEGRRVHASDAPSRLCCIWLAETSPSAVAWVQQMVGLESFIMKVKVSVEIASSPGNAPAAGGVSAIRQGATAAMNKAPTRSRRIVLTAFSLRPPSA
jgi:hypothetical protein